MSGNSDVRYSGVNIQEVLRVLIDRTKYLDGQIRHPINGTSINAYRNVIRLLESRAAERHGRDREPFSYNSRLCRDIETLDACKRCGHLLCTGDCGRIR